ncbi:hypothetical protein SAMN02910353_01906 [Ruminococcus sp. YRD2003]|uniref:hypothetical protein n=1 Tax=Ruminococcus sp. YRD2003 TaxID=1452313 RepID=UPI0008C95365|nr:hypothetical protein SAMN02910353_01906 [Ruminococcus flavefaciens]
MSTICSREAVPVTIGQFTLYCESFRAAASTVLYEQPTVIGGTVISNRCVKATRLTLAGRVYCGAGDIPALTVLNNMNGGSGLTVIYRGVKFTDCTVQGSTAEDRGDDMLYVTLTLATAAQAENAEEVS